MAKFIDIPYFIMKDFIDNIDPYEHVYPSKAHLIGPKTGITAKYGYGVDLWIKDKQDADDVSAISGTSGYYRIRGLPISGTPDDNIFQFHIETNNYRPSKFNITELEKYAGYDVHFIKKKHQIREFINNASYEDGYVNTNKIFLYFGKIYPIDNNRFNIVCDHINNYVYRALPENNRNTNIKQFFNLFFDKIYSKIHNLSKDIWSMVDPFEVNEKYLEYIYNTYDMDYLSDILEFKRREYASALPVLLKRKGTYSSLYIIWKSIISFTTNYLNIYERWHEYDLVGHPNDNFTDYIYITYDHYDCVLPTDGAGSAYYSYTPSGNSLYCEHSQPIASSEWTINHNFGYQYPVVNVLDNARNVISPSNVEFIDDTSLKIKFDDNLTGYASASYGIKKVVRGGAESLIGIYEHTQSNPLSTWIISHNLNFRYCNIQVVNTDNLKIIPHKIKFYDENTSIIEFNTAISGIATVITGDIHKGSIIGNGVHLHTQNTASSIWNITHDMDILYPIISFIDTNFNKIYPLTVTFGHSNIRAFFDSNISGYAILSGYDKIIGITYPEEQSYSTGDLISPHYRVELDLTNEPHGNEYIFNENLSTRLITSWEEIRPVSKYAHYSLVIAPISDFTGSFVSLYDSNVAMNTKCCKPITTYANRVLYRKESAAGSWNVIHNLNTANVIVQCFDLDLNQIIPSKIEYLTMNSIKITFAYAVSGLAFVLPAENIHTESVASSAWAIAHSLNYQYPLVQIEDLSNNSKFFPLSITADDVNNMTVTFVEDTTGYGLTVKGEYLHTQSSSSPIWEINHSLDAFAVQIQCYDNSNKLIYPKNIALLNNNNVEVTFFSSMTGKAVIKAISKSEYSMDTIVNNINYMKVGTSGSSIWDATTNNDIESPIGSYKYLATLTSDDNNHYIESDINTKEDMNITEIGIFDANDDILFYTYNDLLYKASNMELKLFYRIEKKSN